MGHPHEFRTVVESAKILQEYDNLLFLFIGNGKKRSELERLSKGLNNFKLLDFQQIEMLPYSLSSASVHFISLSEGFEGILVPSKYYSAMASGKPIIYEGNPKGEIAREINERGFGKVIEPRNSEQLTYVIKNYYLNDHILKSDGEKAYKTFRQLHYPSNCAKIYSHTICRLVNTKNN